MRAYGCAAEKLRWKVMRLDARLWADDDQPLDEIAQLADITRPGIANKNFHGGAAELAWLLCVGRTEFAKEVFCQRRNVFPAIAQRRHEKWNYVQAIK